MCPPAAIAAVSAGATTNKTQGNSATCNITFTNTVPGSVLVAQLIESGVTAAPTGPAGWTLRATSVTVTGNAVLTTWTHSYTAGEVASYTWTAGAKVDWAGGITTYTGVDTFCPVGATGTTVGTTVTVGKNSTLALPVVTTLVPNSMIVGGYGVPVKNKRFTAPAGWAARIAARSGPNPPSTGSADRAQPAAAATPAANATALNLASGAYMASLIELDPPDIGGLTLTPGTLSFATGQGTSPASQTFTITNTHLKSVCGNQTYSAAVTYSAGWTAANLPVPNVTAVSLGQGATSAAITVSIASGALTAGTYTAVITVTDLSGNIATINVTLSIACTIQRESNVATGSAGAATSLTLTEPSGWNAGDGLVATLVANTTAAPATPAGWTLVGSNTTGGNLGMWVYRAEKSGSATTTWTGFASGKLAGVMAAYLNVNNDLVLDAPATPFAPAPTASGNGNVDTNACTTGVTNTEVVAAYAATTTSASSALTVGPGLTSISGNVTTGAAAGDLVLNVGSDLIVAGAGTALSKTGTIAPSQAASKLGALVTLRPANVPPSASVTRLPAAPTPGDTVTYTIVVTNPTTNGPLTSLVMSDTLPAGVTFVSLTVDAAGAGLTLSNNAGAGAVEGAFGTLATPLVPGAGVTFTLVGTLSCGSVAAQSSTAFATTAGTCGTPAGVLNAFIPGTLVAPSVTVWHDLVAPTQGDTVTYTIGVTNNNPAAPLNALTFSDTLPAGMTVSSFAVNGTGAGLTLTTNPGLGAVIGATGTLTSPLTAGNTVTFTLVAVVDCAAAAPQSNQAYAQTAGGCQPVVSGADAFTPAGVGNPPTVTLTHAPASPAPADVVTYTIVVTNPLGNAPLNALLVSDTLPAGVSFTSLSGGIDGPTADGSGDGLTLSNNFGAGAVEGVFGQFFPGTTLPAGGTFTITLTGTATCVASGAQSHQAYAEIGGVCRKTASGTDSFTVGGTALTVAAVAPVCGVATGGFTLTITGTFGTGTCVPTGVRIGTEAAAILGTPTTSVILATAPSFTGTAVGTAQDVTVTMASGSIALPGGFTPVAAPVVSGVAPVCGVTTGGFTMTITGTFPTGACAPVSVTVGGVNAPIQGTPTAATVLVSVPGGLTAGTVVAVAVTDGTGNGQATGSLAAAYTPRAAPVVTSVAPACGVVAGGFTMTITGTFAPGACAPVSAAINGVNAPIQGTPTTTTVLVAVPAGLPTGIALAVAVTDGTGNGTATGALAAAYTPVVAPVVTSVAPACGVTAGGFTMTITGTFALGACAPVSVTVGGLNAPIQGTPTATTVLVSVPGGLTAGTPVGVSVTDGTGNGSASDTLAAAYTPQTSMGSLAAAAAVRPLASVGQWFTVALTVTNTGGSDVGGVSPALAVGPGGSLVNFRSGPVPAGPVTLGAGLAQTFVWTYSTDGAGLVTFTGSASGTTCAGAALLAAATGSVTAQTPAALVGTLRALSASVCDGDPFLLVLNVTNAGQAAAVAVAAEPPRVDGAGAASFGGPSPAFPVTLAGGAALTFTWTVTGTAPGVAEFATTVTGTDANSALAVPTGRLAAPSTTLLAPAVLDAAGSAPVNASTGQWIEVVLTVTNTGGAQVRNLVPAAAVAPAALLVFIPPAPSGVAALEAGASMSFTWTLSVSGVGSADITLTATGDACAGATVLGAVTVSLAPQQAADLVAAVHVMPSSVCQGDAVLVTVTVTDTGGVDAAAVSVSDPLGSGAGSLVKVAGPTPASPIPIPTGQARTFTWTYTGVTAGAVVLTATATGTDVFSSLPVTSGPRTAPVTVLVPGALAAAAAAPAKVSAGQVFTVALTVTNTGQAAVTAVTPALAVGPGAALVEVEAAPAPVTSLAGGASATFVWTLSASGSGPVTLTATATGATCAAGTASGSAGVGFTVQTPAALAAFAAVFRSPLCIGDATLVTLTITNGGQADAVLVTAPDFAAGGTGGVTLTDSPAAAFPVTLAGGAARTFTWTYTGAVSGPVVLSTTATGQDGNAGFALTTGPVTTASFVVQMPGALVAAAAAPGTVSIGQIFTVALTVTNTGEADVTGIAPALAVGPGAALVTLHAAPAAVPALAGGAAATLVWTFSADGAGAVAFTLTAAGSTCAATAVAASGTASTTVQAPAALAAAAAAYRDPLCTGDTMLVTLTVTNTGAADAVLVAAPDFASAGVGAVTLAGSPGAAFPVTLAGGAARTFTWTYTGAVAGAVALTTTATGQDANTGAALSTGPVTTAPMAVVAPGALTASASVVPLASLGQWFDVVLTVTNTGGADVTGVAAVEAVGPGAARVDLISTSGGFFAIGPGAQASFAWTFSATASGTVTFTLTASGSTCAATPVMAAASAAAVMQTPAQLSASPVAHSATVCDGDVFLVTVTAANAGEATAAAVAIPAFTFGGAGGASLVAGPSPALPGSLAGGATVTWTWTVAGAGPGAVLLTATVTAQDANTGAPLTAGPLTTPPVTVLGPGTLVAAVAAPAAVSVGQWFTVALTVTNTGEAGVTQAAPAIVVGPGGALVTPEGAAPLPADLGPGVATTFVWTYSASGAGPVIFTATATGGTCAAGVVSAAASVPVLVTGPAALAAALAVYGPAACPAVPFLVTLTVTNTGGADALNVTAPDPASLGTGSATRTAGPDAAFGVTLIPGQSRTWTWTYTGATPGAVTLSTTATGQDVYSGFAVSSGSVGSASFAVLSPAALVASLSVENPIAQGTLFKVYMTVTNTGTATANVTALAAGVGPGAGIAYLAAGAPLPTGFSLGGGASQTVEWTFTAAGGGDVTFTATAFGTTCAGGIVMAQASVSSTVLFGVPALSLVSLTVVPGQATLSQTITVVLTVVSSGVGPATGVAPTAIIVSGTAGLILDSGPVPATAGTLTAGQTASFTWTYHAVRGGPVAFAVGATSTNGASVPVTSSAPISIVEAGTTVENAEIFPLPFNFRTAQGGTLKFRRLPSDTKVRIYTAAGELVHESRANANGMAEWDGRNDDGSRVASGVYFYVLEPPRGGRKVGKIEVQD